MLRVLHGHIQRKRKGLLEIRTQVAQMVEQGDIDAKAGAVLIASVENLLRTDDELTPVERDIIERDSRMELVLRERYPMLSDTLLIVCICTIDGLTTAEIASIIHKSEKSVDHYRQEIRGIINAKGASQSLRSLLSEIAGA
jgi:DNA-binding CsgD family transcriptional regulator